MAEQHIYSFGSFFKNHSCLCLKIFKKAFLCRKWPASRTMMLNSFRTNTLFKCIELNIYMFRFTIVMFLYSIPRSMTAIFNQTTLLLKTLTTLKNVLSAS